jgi:hypothetical protein
MVSRCSEPKSVFRNGCFRQVNPLFKILFSWKFESNLLVRTLTLPNIHFVIHLNSLKDGSEVVWEYVAEEFEGKEDSYSRREMVSR